MPGKTRPLICKLDFVLDVVGAYPTAGISKLQPKDLIQPTACFVNTVLLEAIMPICFCIVCGCFHADTTELCSYNRGCTAYNPL